MYDTSFSKYNKHAVAFLIEGIMKARTVNLKDVVTKVNSGSRSDSLYRRFQRLFKKEMEFCGIGVFLLRSFLKMCFIALGNSINIYLSIDRHEWRFGSKTNNLLVAHLFEPVTGIDFPVSVIDLNRPGNSSTLDRGDLISHLLPFLQPYIDDGRLIVTVLGDREFFSRDWLMQLSVRNIKYIIRLKRDYVLSDARNVGSVYDDLCVNESTRFNCGDDIVVIKKLESVVGRRDSCLAVISNLCDFPSNVLLEEYLIRWNIERAFFNMESNGWQLKKTHLKMPKRIEMMFYILSFCYYFAVLFGYINLSLKRIRNKNHGYRSITFFLDGRRFIDELFTRNLIVSIRDLGNHIYILIAKLLTKTSEIPAASGVV